MRVLLVEDDDDVRETMREILSVISGDEIGSVGYASYHDLVEHREEALNTDLAILDINLGEMQPSGIDVENWLRLNNYGGRIVFLTGHSRNHPLVKQAAERNNILILEKPIHLSKLVEIVGLSLRKKSA